MLPFRELTGSMHSAKRCTDQQETGGHMIPGQPSAIKERERERGGREYAEQGMRKQNKRKQQEQQFFLLCCNGDKIGQLKHLEAFTLW